MKTCACCSLAKSEADFGVDRSRRDGLCKYCKACAKLKRGAYMAKNPAAVRAAKNAYDRRNAESIKAWREANADHLKAYWADYGRRYRTEFKAETAAKTRRQQAARRRAVPLWFDQGAETAIYKEAERLRALGQVVDVDHIFPIAGKNVCGLHWHGNLQIISSAANRRKGNRVEDGVQPLAFVPS